MPSNTHVNAGLSLIENDKTKILGLTVGNHQNVQPGQYIPRAGEYPDTAYAIPMPSEHGLTRSTQMPKSPLRSPSRACPHPRPTWS